MRTFLAALMAAALSGPAMAQSTSYFIEGVLGGGSGEISVDDDTVIEKSFNRTSADLTINLGSVNTTGIPFSETQFLNRSSFIQFRQANQASDDADDQIDRTATARWVLRSGTYFTVIGDLDTENSDNNVYEVQLGKFTDANTAMFAGYVVDQLDNVDIYTFGTHFTAPYGDDSGWITYDFSGQYMTEGKDNEYALGIGVTYYPSFRSSIGIHYEFADGRLTDSHDTTVFGEYYFSARFGAKIEATSYRYGNVDSNFAGMSLKLRF